MSFHVRPELSRIAPYVPGKPVAEVEREYGVSHAIKLASNENPLGPSPAALKAAREVLEGLHRYPDGAGVALRDAIASRFGVQSDHVILGNGSDEVVALLCNVLLTPGDEAVMATPTFGIYRIAVLAHQGTPVEVPLAEGRHDLAAMLARVLETKVCSRLAINVCSLSNMVLSTLASNTGRSQASPLGLVFLDGFMGRMLVGKGYAGRGATSREVPNQFSAGQRSTGLGEINAIIAICMEKQHP